MKIITETTPYDFLVNKSWECESLQNALPDDKIDAFNDYVEATFPDGASETELNDFLRFDWEEILSDLGVETEDED